MTSRLPWFHTSSVKRRTSTFCCSAVMLPPLHLHPEPLHVPQVDCVTVSLPVHPGPGVAAYCVPTAVRPKTWFSALSGERREPGKPVIQSVHASRNTPFVTPWGSDYRLPSHQWSPPTRAYLNGRIELGAVEEVRGCYLLLRWFFRSLRGWRAAIHIV